MQTGPMWLLRSSSAKKINKPFDHKGPIHSVSPSASLFLSFFLPFPPPLIPASFSLVLPVFFLIAFPSCGSLPFLFYLSILSSSASSSFGVKDSGAAERPASSDQPGARHTDRHSDTDKGLLIPQTQSWCRAEEHNMENVFITPSLVQKHGEGTLERTFPPPATSPLSRTRRLPCPGSTTERVCECFLMHTDGAGVKIGRPFPLQFCCCERVLLSLSGCGSITICPLRPIFHFQNTPDFLREKTLTWEKQTEAWGRPPGRALTHTHKQNKIMSHCKPLMLGLILISSLF